ncbi:PREDICTED: adhesion G-protein coupled receptor G2-like [Amphimedon queenslandica]|uniref:GAIN-B domain-containing protein n=1 Tax=Amphimedon queenslandica TaxID=400682 RepID=A0AAN0J8A8_AMPQE|nr:PREDICTED: adhesion G-protein coupled receptor G2-like [Amphimedon queenslandica]|eukprot:XP_019853255.1 PREDICTED: adhesion G-protein coupled receptor G2-like [Amphimedon queenslandica]
MIDTVGDSTDTEIGSITIPKGILNVTTDAKIKVAFSLYEETAFFPIRDPPPNTIVGSSVISARIAGVSDGTQLPNPVVITLALKANNFSNPCCVYWDFNAAEGRGNWSTDGCTVEAANSSVTCHCNHLTNFAILVSFNSSHSERMKISLTTTDAVKMVASFISILIPFGLTWVLAIFTFITKPSVSYVIQFFFCFFNAFQGFFIFLFFIVFNSESRNAWNFCRESVSKDKMQSTATQAR